MQGWKLQSKSKIWSSFKYWTRNYPIDIIVHSKETISISFEDNESITNLEEEDLYDNDITSKLKATEDIIFRGSKKYINPDNFNIPVIKLNSVPDDINDLVVYEVPNPRDISKL